jgi:hypothetical protein
LREIIEGGMMGEGHGWMDGLKERMGVHHFGNEDMMIERNWISLFFVHSMSKTIHPSERKKTNYIKVSL